MPKDIDLSLLAPILERYRGREDALIAIMQEIQEVYGYLPEVVLAHLSREVKIPLSRIYGVVTFYSQFYLTPRGRQTVRVCQGTACHVQGCESIITTVKDAVGIGIGETTGDLQFSLETVACIEACALAPTMVINLNTYGKMTPKRAAEVISLKDNKERER